jgi:hypothetical protein
VKVCVVVPSAEYLAQAGVRIRYRRIEPYLAALGHQLMLAVIDEFRRPDHLDCDVYLFSKCYDARAIVLARLMHAAGKLTGADFFDDIFSQFEDSRFLRQRAWLRDIGEAFSFALCSTQRIRDVIAAQLPTHPIHVLNDPLDHFDVERIGRRIEQKREEVLSTRQISVAWFGIGDNPHFPVGLADLSSFGAELRCLGSGRFAVDLQILTNRRALDIEGLRMLRRLAVPYRISEWSEDAETDLLDESFLSFLPVNGQNFSTAKSLNRGLSALRAGTQILSVGYPLYEPLSAFVYREVDPIGSDIESGYLRLRSDTLRSLGVVLKDWGDPTTEASRLADFLVTLRPPTPNLPVKLAVIHGRRSPASTHKLAQRLGHLSVATPFSKSGLNYDVRVVPIGEQLLKLKLTSRALARLRTAFTGKLTADGEGDNAAMLLFWAPPALVERLAITEPANLAAATVSYDLVMKDLTNLLDHIFPGTHLIFSESDVLVTNAASFSKGNDPKLRIASDQFGDATMTIAQASTLVL